MQSDTETSTKKGGGGGGGAGKEEKKKNKRKKKKEEQGFNLRRARTVTWNGEVYLLLGLYHNSGSTVARSDCH